ncbi:MAG: DUF885 domain-containing protein [Actinomycetota bacterium]
MSAKSANDEAVAKLADDVWKWMIARSPIWGTFLGMEVDDGALDDTSDAARLEDRAGFEGFAATAAAIGDDDLSVESRITREVIRVGTSIAIERDDHRMDLVGAVDHMEGPQTLLPQLAAFQDASTPERLEKFLRRIAGFPAYMDGILARVEEGERQGLTAPRVVVERLIAQLQGLVEIPAASSPIVVAARVAGDAERERVADAVREHVDPQIRRYLGAVRGSYEAASRDVPGLCSAPDGLARYGVAIRAWTGLALDPKELHEIGLEEWSSIREEMRAISREMGYGGDIPAMRAGIEADPANVAASKDALIARIREDIDRALEAAGTVFGRFPKAGCDVKPVEEFKEKDAPAAYYFSPAADGSRPGTYYVNAYELPTRFLHSLAAVTYHEAIPGHHFQLAIEQEIASLPDLRRHASHIAGSAYSEGWGLYSERLADELGLYRNPAERYGMLIGQAHRAARLVVDTGIHAFGWERHRGVEFLEEVGLPRVEAEIETDRYISWPGQALCYKVGQRVIERTRRAIEARDGDRFDVRSFHDEAIGHGQLPLPVFEAEMPNWVRPKG